MIYISIGSNLGNRLANLRQAVWLIKANILDQTYESIILETKALLKNNAPKSWDKPFLNMVIVGKTELSPHDLYKKLVEIERQVGRIYSKEKWAPRIIDLDILIYNDQMIDTSDIKIPHPELLNRDFLLHLLALMPGEYRPFIQTQEQKIRVDEYAHNHVDFTDLFTKAFALGPCIVGVLNVTPDSFSDSGKNFDPEMAVENAYKMVRDGAEIIDIGAQSTRPGIGKIIGPEKEYERLSPILNGLKNIDAKVSIDTYHPELINRLLQEYKIDWINDVTGNLSGDVLQEIALSGCKILTMHSLSIPLSKKKILPHDIPTIESIRVWGEKVIEKMQRYNFSEEDIIIDPGIGFGKSIYQNLDILKGIQEIKKLGVKILIGHSRKSFMTGFVEKPAPQRDIETIAISGNLDRVEADFIRVHNVRDHHRLLVANRALR